MNFNELKIIDKPPRDPLPKSIQRDLLGARGRAFLAQVNKNFERRLKKILKKQN